MSCQLTQINAVIEKLSSPTSAKQRAALKEARSIRDEIVELAYLHSDDIAAQEGLSSRDAMNVIIDKDETTQALNKELTDLDVSIGKASDKAKASKFHTGSTAQRMKGDRKEGRGVENAMTQAIADNSASITGQINEIMELTNEMSKSSSEKHITKLRAKISKARAYITKLEGYIIDNKKVRKQARSNQTKTTNLFSTRDELIIKREEKRDELKAHKALFSAAARVLNDDKAPANSYGAKLSNWFSPKMVYNNISRLGSITGDNFSKAIESLTIKKGEKVSLDRAKKLMEFTERYIRSSLAQNAEHGNINKIDVAEVQGVEGYQNISKLLMQDTESGKRELAPEVITAMSAVINDWMVNTGAMRWNMRTDKDINRFYGVQGDSPAQNKHRKALMHVDTLNTTAANDMGAAIVRELGITADIDKSEISPILLDKLKTELGLISIQAMEKAGLIRVYQDNVSKIYPDDKDAGDKKLEVIEFTEKGKTFVDTKERGLQQGTKYIHKLLGTESRVKAPRFSKHGGLKEFINQSAIGKWFTTPKKTQKALNRAENVAWTWNETYMQDLLDMASTESSRQVLREYLGWENPDIAHKRNREGIRGKNNAIENNINHLVALHEEMQLTGDKEMFFNYFFGKNGRFYIDSNTFNPQGTKLHRFAIGTGEFAVESDLDVDLQDLAMAHAFGVDIDKLTRDHAIAEWRVIEAKLDKMGINEKPLAEILPLIEEAGIHGHDPEHLLGGVAEYRRYSEYKSSNGDIKGFKGRLVLEIDAVTSGYILKSLQMPLLADVEYHLEGGGVFVKNEGKYRFESFGEQYEYDGSGDKGEATKDAYQKPAEDMASRITKMFKKGVHPSMQAATELSLKGDIGSVPVIKRNHMKFPFMYFNYGAGLDMIESSFSNDAIDRLYDLMVLSSDNEVAIKTKKEDIGKKSKAILSDVKATDQVVAAIRASSVGFKYDFKNKVWKKSKQDLSGMANQEAEKFLALPADKRLEYELPAALEANIQSAVKASLGVALRETFETTYAPYIAAGKTINNSFTAMFRLFKAKLDGRVDAEQEALGRHLNPIEMDELIDELKDSMPAIKMALAEDIDDKLLIFDEQAGNYDKLEGSMLTGQGKFRYGNKTVGTKAEITAAKKAYDVAVTNAEAIEEYATVGSPAAITNQKKIVETLKPGSAVHSKAASELGKLRRKKRGQGGHYIMTSTTAQKAADKAVMDAGELLKELETEVVLSAQAKRYELVESYASGAVIPIHFLDGSHMTDSVAASDSLGVHDAKMTLPNVAIAEGVTYNKSVADIGSSYSLTTEILDSMIQSMNLATAVEMQAVNQQYYNESFDKDNAETVGSIFSGMKDLQRTAEDGREALFGKDMRIEHVAIEDGHYDRKGGYTRQEPATDLTYDFTKDLEILKEPVEDDTQSDVNSAIISDKSLESIQKEVDSIIENC